MTVVSVVHMCRLPGGKEEIVSGWKIEEVFEGDDWRYWIVCWLGKAAQWDLPLRFRAVSVVTMYNNLLLSCTMVYMSVNEGGLIG